MRRILLFVLIVGCGSKNSETESVEAGLVIPAGVYRMGKEIKAGVESPPTGTATVTVAAIGDGRTQFTISGELESGYSCQPRIWVAAIGANGDASSVERTQENCTVSMPKSAYEALKRNYRMSGTSFVERITDGEAQLEFYYDK